jgi:hypothetical protein
MIESPMTISRQEFKLTGYRALNDYGLFLITGQSWQYFYSSSRKKLRLEDICLHLLATTIQLNRDIIYISIAILKNKDIWRWRYIENEAKSFQVKDMVKKLKIFIESQGEKTPKEFPSWDEVKETAKGYDVNA